MPDRRLAAVAPLLAAVLALTACAAPAPASAPAVRAAPAPADRGLAAGPQTPVPEAPPPAASVRPLRIVIPRIGVDAALLDLARGSDGMLEAPPPTRLDEAGWYAEGTVPGRIGPAVIAGHLDWAKRPAVFQRLDELRPGDLIAVRMSDRTTVRFVVDTTRSVDKDRFPTQAVYGATPDAQLRVITCGGPWDEVRNIYRQNLVVSATRTS